MSCSTGTLMGAERVRFPPFQLPPDKASPLLNSIAQRSFRHMGQHGKRKERDSKGAGLSLLFLYLEDQLGLMWGGQRTTQSGNQFRVLLGLLWGPTSDPKSYQVRSPIVPKSTPKSIKNLSSWGSRGLPGGWGRGWGASWVVLGAS